MRKIYFCVLKLYIVKIVDRKMIILVVLATVQLSCGAIPMMRNIMEPQFITFDDVKGMLYDMPEFDDPLVIQHQLSSIGAMPFFTMLKASKGQDRLKLDDVSEKTKIAESKKIIDEALSRLELARAKLEKGNGNIYAEVEKVTQSLKWLEKSSRQDMRQVLNSLQSIMTLGNPMMMMPDFRELITTSEPGSDDKTEVLESPEITDSQTLSVRVISSDKPEFGENKPIAKDAYNSAEKFTEGEKTTEKSKALEFSELSEETYEITKLPFEYRMKEKKNFDGDDEFSSYKAKLTWKAAGLA